MKAMEVTVQRKLAKLHFPALMRAAHTRLTTGATGGSTGKCTRSKRPGGSGATNATLLPTTLEWEVAPQ